MQRHGCRDLELPAAASQLPSPTDEALWCRLTRPVPAGGQLKVLLVAKPPSNPSHPVKKEPAEPESPAPSHPDIQLLPQQAGMASILATAVINSE